MTSALRCRCARLTIPNPNLVFIRQYADKKDKISEPKAVASHIFQKMEKAADYSQCELKQNEFPEEPTTCCMSGCANCVWLEYAEKINAYYRDGGESAMKEINLRVHDTNIKAFLMHELRMRQKTS